ncbi:hypothetical protein V5799_005672 [Amblyomma americanum]|uniref:Uncharacterized protein n=1 Tax=Amblyomma americanum TaxID=6943 RepID=A0AAQ4DYK7_AMBAM
MRRGAAPEEGRGPPRRAPLRETPPGASGHTLSFWQETRYPHFLKGWSTSDAKPKKSKEELREYLESLKDEMDGRRDRLRDELLQEAKSNTGDLATVMDQSLVGKPPISTALRRRTRHLL